MSKVLYLIVVSVLLLFSRFSSASENLALPGLSNSLLTTDTLIPATSDTSQVVFPAATPYAVPPSTTAPEKITGIPVPEAHDIVIKPIDSALILNRAKTGQEDAVIPDVAINQIIPFDQHFAYSVVWDSLMIRNDTHPISRVYPAKTIYGEHELQVQHMRNIKYEPERTAPKIFILLIVINLFLIGLANYFFPQKLREMIMAAWEPRIYSQLEKEGVVMTHWVSFFLYFNFLLTLTILVYLLFEFFRVEGLNQGIPPLLLKGYILFSLVTYYLIKYLLVVSIGLVFNRQESSQAYFRNILIVNNFTGLVILPLMIIYVFNPSDWVMYISLGLLLVLNVYKIGRGAIVGHQKTGFSAYYLILYLCTIEIAPVLFLIKITMNYLTG